MFFGQKISLNNESVGIDVVTEKLGPVSAFVPDENFVRIPTAEFRLVRQPNICTGRREVDGICLSACALDVTKFLVDGRQKRQEIVLLGHFAQFGVRFVINRQKILCVELLVKTRDSVGRRLYVLAAAASGSYNSQKAEQKQKNKSSREEVHKS